MGPLDDGRQLNQIKINRLPGERDILRRQHDHRRAKPLGDVECVEREPISGCGVGGGKHRQRKAAGGHVPCEDDVALAGGGRTAGGRPHSLAVDDNQRHLTHLREPDVLAIQTEARAGRSGEGLRTGHRRADALSDRGDFVFGLDGRPTGLRKETDELGENRTGRGDGVAGNEVAAGADRPADDGLIAGDEFVHATLPDGVATLPGRVDWILGSALQVNKLLH